MRLATPGQPAELGRGRTLKTTSTESLPAAGASRADRRFSATHARRQYDAVDPDNRLVAGELERRWNEALQIVYRLEGEVAAIEARKPASLGEKERRHLQQLGADLELAWSHPAATAATRKRLLRAALYEIVVRIEGSLIEMILHWQGGDHTELLQDLQLLRVEFGDEHADPGGVAAGPVIELGNMLIGGLSTPGEFSAPLAARGTKGSPRRGG
jgi:hypothetical protein